MKETGIIVSGDHPKKILDGTKTMTRRVSKFANHLAEAYDHCWVYYDKKRNQWQFKGRSRFSDLIETFILDCPYGQVGDRLWVRETWTDLWMSEIDLGDIVYKATPPNAKFTVERWKPSIFMPRWASRITLEITEVRVERLQEITEEDALAEGIQIMQGTWQAMEKDADTGRLKLVGEQHPYTARYHFEALWDSLNAKRGFGWETNPWVWVISFRKEK